MPTRADYAKINIACKDLKIDKYDLLADRYGLSSTKELSKEQLADLYGHFQAKGWRPSRSRKSEAKGQKKGDFITIEPGPAAARQRKILAMWNQLGYPMAKLHARCKKQFKIERFEWVVKHDHLHILITDLENRLKSKGKI